MNRLRSEKGASISYALLLFLVCAAIGAVVLVAATSASGRLAGMAEADQRYYSAVSAAELLKDAFDGREVTVVTTSTVQTVTRYSYEGGQASEDSSYPEKTMFINGNFIPPGADFRPETLFEEAAYRLYSADPLAVYPMEKSFLLKASGAPEKAGEALNVRCVSKLMKDGTVTMDISCPAGEDSAPVTGVYTLRMVFGADVRKDTSTIAERGTPQPEDSGSGYSISSIATETVTSVITWRLDSIRLVSGTS